MTIVPKTRFWMAVRNCAAAAPPSLECPLGPLLRSLAPQLNHGTRVVRRFEEQARLEQRTVTVSNQFSARLPIASKFEQP
jgi:hypothetical protein